MRIHREEVIERVGSSPLFSSAAAAGKYSKIFLHWLNYWFASSDKPRAATRCRQVWPANRLVTARTPSSHFHGRIMSVVINTNFAATLAANNLAASSNLLQRSLNRLSSGSRIVNPADDAGGMAVSTKLSAAARRQGAAVSNLGNAVSYLQTQDGVMKTTGKVLERMGELKTLANDPTKNASDIANYND
jgi:hypothetical protein